MRSEDTFSGAYGSFNGIMFQRQYWREDQFLRLAFHSESMWCALQPCINSCDVPAVLASSRYKKRNRSIKPYPERG